MLGELSRNLTSNFGHQATSTSLASHGTTTYGHTMRKMPMDTKSREAHDLFVKAILDLNLSQMVHQPTRGSNTLDLFLTTYTEHVNRTETLPPLGKETMI